jgi:ABC-type multidrug transport system fused ATPase/permease subunit
VKRIWITFNRLTPLLDPTQRRFIWAFIVASTMLSLLDVLALGLLTVSVAAMSQGQPIDVPILGVLDRDQYVWIFLAVCLLIILKSALNIVLQWMATRRFAGYELRFGDKLFDAYLKAPWIERMSRSAPELVRLADVGVSAATSGFLLPMMTLPSLLATFVAVFAIIIIAQPVTALIALVYFALVGLVLYRWISRRAIRAGRTNRAYSMRTARLMSEMVHALKEVTLRNKSNEVAGLIHQERVVSTRARSNAYFLGVIPKFVLDGALVAGLVLVGVANYLFGGMEAALASIAVFAVAGLRILPTVVSFQGLVTNAQANLVQIDQVIDDIETATGYVARAEVLSDTPLTEEPRVLRLESVTFSYPGAARPALQELSLEIPMGGSVGIVGASGAGKSTLIDILLGLLEPSDGRILLDGRPLTEVLSGWRSRVGYVPQTVSIFDASIAQNIALSWGQDVDEARVQRALERAHLWEFVQSRPGGMHARVGDQGMMLSGGQRQRLGIARALFTEPAVLVLDEATSALDTKTEADVSQSIRELEGETTVISVAHRLSTVKDSDQLCYMADGRIVARGSFDELLAAVPEFREQATLAGLT